MDRQKGMQTTTKQPEFNPFAPPVVSAPVEPELVSAKRASLQTLREVNVWYVVAEMSYIAVFVSFFCYQFLAFSSMAQLGWIAFCVTSFVFWCSTMVGLFKARGITVKTIFTVLLLPVPILGTIVFLSAKQEMRCFMVFNGFLQEFVGFREDPEERNAMAKDPDYIPSLYFDRNGKRRGRGFGLNACVIMTFVLIGVIILVLA